MIARRFAELFIRLVLSIFPMTAIAREFSDATMLAAAQEISESDNSAILQEIKAFNNVKISVREVIAIAEKLRVGAKAVDVGFDGTADRLANRVKTCQQDKIWESTIDASTGKVTGEENEKPVSTLDIKARAELAGFSTAGIDLSEVVRVAEEYGSGKAVSAGFEKENGKLIFLVVVVTDGSLRTISVDPNEGQSRLRNAFVGEKR
jgi:uncharacterized membrane protein YkoI